MDKTQLDTIAASPAFTIDDFEEVPIDPSALKSWSTRLKISGRSQFSLGFDPIFQMHGRLEPSVSAKEEASLVVLRFRPQARRPHDKIVELTIKIHVLPPNPRPEDQTHDEDSDDDSSDLYGIDSYEPAGRGEEFVGEEHKISVTKDRTAEFNLSAPIGGPSVGLNTAASRSEAFEKRQRLTMKASLTKFDPLNRQSRRNVVEWAVQAANKHEGIGDLLTVAFLVIRPCGTQFRLNYFCEARLGSMVDAVMNLSQSIERKKWDCMPWKFQPNDQSDQIGSHFAVDSLNLRGSIRDSRFWGEFGVGHHVAEQVKAVAFHKTEDGAQKTADGVPTSSKQAPEHTQELDSHLKVLSSSKSEITGHEAEKSFRKDEKPYASKTTDRTESPNLAKCSRCEDHAKRVLSGSNLQSRRGERLRMMAALYERLAKLHREEADEELGQAEVAYADDVVNVERK